VSSLIALDIALLPPPEVRARAVDISSRLPTSESHGLRLDDEHLPHVTLTQQFIRGEEREAAFEKVDEVLRGQPPLHLTITGGDKGNNSVFMAVDPTPELRDLHDRLMEALRGLERPGGTPAAFIGGDARIGDVMWVASYRLKSSFAAYAPHITLGHADKAPEVAPMSFTASIVAACHLGRYCTCREILRSWTL
jgi:2'-5' RNA ligase